MNANGNQTPLPAPRRLIIQFAKYLAVFICGFLLCSIFVLVALLAKHASARRELDAWKQAQQAKGEEFDINKLAPPLTPPDKNEIEWRQASEQLVAVPIIPSDLCGFDFASPAHARVLWKEESPVRSKSELTWNQLENQMQQSAEALEKIRVVLKSPPQSRGADYKAPWSWHPNLVHHRVSAQWLCAAAMNDLHHDRRDAAVENLTALSGIVRSYEQDSSLVNVMIRSAVSSLAVSAVWQALQAPGWTEGQLARLQGAWQSVELVHQFERSVQLERAVQLNSFRLLKESPWDFEQKHFEFAKQFAEMTHESNPPQPSHSLMKRWLYFPAWKFFSADRDELLLLQSIEPEIETIRSISPFIHRQPLPALKSKEILSNVKFDAITPLPDAIQSLLQTIASENNLPLSADQHRIAVIAEAGLKDVKAELHFANLTAAQALEALLDNWNLALFTNPNSHTIQLGARDEFMQPPTNQFTFELPHSEFANEIIRAIHFDADTTLLETARTLAMQGAFNILFDPRLENRAIGTEWYATDISPRDALQRFLNENGLIIRYSRTTMVAQITAKELLAKPWVHPNRFSWPDLRNRMNDEHLRAEGKLQLLKPDGRNHFFPTDYLPVDLSRACSTLLHNETDREMMTAAITLKRYELRNHRYPERLTELVPDYLPRLPHDYMADQALHYHANADGTFTLYSVGDDSLDNGGEIGPSDSIERWKARDVLWPMSAIELK